MGRCGEFPRPSSACCPTSRARRGRARLRHGVLLGLARAARRAAGRRRRHAGAARDGARAAGGDGLEFPLVEADAEDVPLPDAIVRPRRLGVRRVDLGRPVPLDPRGGAAAAAGRRLVFLRNSTLVDALCGRSTGRAETLQRPQRGLHRLDWEADGGRVPPPARRLDRPAARDRVRASSDSSSSTRPTTPRRTATTTPSRRVGATLAVPRRSGRRASGERARRRPAAARVDLAAAARDPRAARHPVRRRRAALRGARPAGRRRRRARPRARAREGALGRRGSAAERPVLGVDTAVVVDGATLGKPANAAEAERMLERAVGPDARGRLRPLPAHARLGGGRARDDARHVPRADAARARATTSRAASGRAARARTRSRASAPPRRADRGRLPERRRPSRPALLVRLLASASRARTASAERRRARPAARAGPPSVHG